MAGSEYHAPQRKFCTSGMSGYTSRHTCSTKCASSVMGCKRLDIVHHCRPADVITMKFTTHAIAFHDDAGRHVFTSALLLDPRIVPSLPSDLSSCSHLTPSPPPFDIRDAGPDKGFGMFATRQISAGALILIEHPTIITPAALPPAADLEGHVAVYRALSAHLRPEDRKELLTMANCRSVEECPTVEEGVSRTNGTAITLPLPLPDDDKIQDPKTKQYGATFLKICRSNHSCTPNAALKWSLSTFSSSLYALRPIAPSEEITIIYTDITQPMLTRRNHLFSHYGFLCTCPACSLPQSLIPASDAARTALRDWRHTRPSYAGWWKDICRSDDVLITSHMEALGLVEREGLHMMQAVFVEEICLCWALLGEEAKFRKWAEKLMELSQVQDPALAREVKRWLENPQKRVKRWGWRKKERLEIEKRQRKAPPSPEIYCSPLLFSAEDF